MAEDDAKIPSEVPKKMADHVVTGVVAVLNSIPIPGAGGLATYLDEFYPGQAARQIKDFMECLKDHAKRIDKLNCNQDRLRSLVSQVILEIPKTTSDDKRAAFRAIILNYACGKSGTDHEIDAYMAVLAPLTDLEMQILRIAKAPREEATARGLIEPGQFSGEEDVRLRRIISGISEEILMCAYDGLRTKRLIDGPQLPGAAMGGELCLGHLRLSSFGRNLIDWIVQPE